MRRAHDDDRRAGGIARGDTGRRVFPNETVVDRDAERPCARSVPSITNARSDAPVLTLGALSALRALGLRVAHDVSVIAFDDPPYAHLLDPALTTLRQPTDALGTAAAEMLLDRLELGFVTAARRFVVAPELIERASTGAPRSSAP